MIAVSHSILYSLLFIALYFEVFMLITYLENRHEIRDENKNSSREPRYYPSVSVIVPCWNEEKTITKTIQEGHSQQYLASRVSAFLKGSIFASKKDNSKINNAKN